VERPKPLLLIVALLEVLLLGQIRRAATMKERERELRRHQRCSLARGARGRGRTARALPERVVGTSPSRELRERRERRERDR
jgi:hypothetical protein